MKSKSLVLMALSLGFGLVAAVGISQVMGRNNQNKTPEVATLPVMVALDHLDSKTKLTEENCTIEQWPATMVPPDAVGNFEEVKDKLLSGRVAKKMPILKDMVVTRDKFVELPIPAGMKVVGIRMPPDDLIGGLLTPGDRVDLIGVFGAPNGAKVTRTFLTNVQVFSIDNNTQTELDRKQKGTGGAIVGVLVSKLQAEQLILAQAVGQIKLALASSDDPGPSLNVSDPQQALASLDAFDVTPKAQPEPAKDEDDEDAAHANSTIGKVLNGLLKTATKENSHTVVMITPNGPTSYVFVESSPVPQKIDGYFTPPSHGSKPAPGDLPPAPAVDIPAADDVPAASDQAPADAKTEPSAAADSVGQRNSADQEDLPAGNNSDLPGYRLQFND